MAGHIIRQLEERHLAVTVDLMVWSNKMDLLALSNSKGEVSLHRLTWERVWLLSPPTADMVVRKLAWRLDGRVIAVAYVPKVIAVGQEVKGEVKLIDVENKDILHSVILSDDVSCLVWLQGKQFQNQHFSGCFNHRQDESDFLPKLPPFSRTESDFLPELPPFSRTLDSLLFNIKENIDDTKRTKNQMQLNFLLIGTFNGNLHLSVFGMFSCGLININKYMADTEKGKYASVLNAEISPDMKSLLLLVAVDERKVYAETVKANSGDSKTDNTEVEKDDENENADKKSADEFELVIGREYKVVKLDTRVLSSMSGELHALSLKHGYIISLLDYLSKTMRSIIEAWENMYILEIESKLSKYTASLPEGTVSADFLELLLFGKPSESLECFLMEDLHDKGIDTSLGQSIKLIHSNIQLILNHLLSAGQNLAYHLAEMKGMAKLTDRFKVLGLEEDILDEAFSAAGAFLIKGMEVQLVIEESKKRYGAFFKWLYAIILRMTDDRNTDHTMSDLTTEDLELIADYLHKLDIRTAKDGVTKRHGYLDHIGQSLVTIDLTVPNNIEHDNLWQQLLQKNPRLQDNVCIIKKCKNTPLLQQHGRLNEVVSNVFKTPEYTIGNMFQLDKIVEIGKIAIKRLSTCLLDNNMILLSLVESNSPDRLQLIQIAANGNKSDIKVKTVLFKDKDEVVMKCLDVQFYLPDVLSVLLEETDEDRNAVIVQLKSKTIYDSTLDVIDGNSLTGSVVTCQIPDMVASIFAVSGTRKVAIVLSKDRRKVKLFEMEGEDEDNDDIVLMETPTNFVEAPTVDCRLENAETVVDEDEIDFNDLHKLIIDASKISLEPNLSIASHIEEGGGDN